MRAARAVLVVTILAAPLRASADTGARAAMEEYFAGEKRGGYVLIGMGAVGLATGGLLYADGSDIARGASYPLLGVGLVHVAAGADRYRVKLDIEAGTDPVTGGPIAFLVHRRVF